METRATPRGPVVIRAVTDGDAAAYRELRLEALRSAPTAFGTSAEAAEQLTPQEWRDRMKNNNARLSLVAEAADELVGMTVFRRDEGAKVQHQAYVNSVYIRSGWRSLGILDAFLTMGYAWTLAQHVSIVKLSVTATNTSAIRAYTRLGFSIYGVEPDVLLWEGKYYDELLMYRRLSGDV